MIPAQPAGVVDAVCLPARLLPAPAGFLFGIDKRAVPGPVRVTARGIDGDHQGDTEHHGGTFKAVYAFSRAVREEFAAAEGRDLPDGFFGENLVVTGYDVDGAIIGERWRIGSAVLETTCVRNPCRTFAARMDDRAWPRRFSAGGRCGSYLRVIEEGEIAPGDAIEVLERPGHGVSLECAFQGLAADGAERLLAWSARTGTVLYDSLARSAETAIRRAGGEAAHPEALRSTGR